MSDFLSDGVAVVIARIALCEDNYLPLLRDAHAAGLRGREAGLLEHLDAYLPGLVEVFDTHIPARPHGSAVELVLEELYYQWNGTTSGDLEARRRALIGAFLATETERNGQFRLHRAQNFKMAAHYEALANEFLAEELYGHAALAFERAADVYLVLKRRTDRDRCLLGAARAQHQTRDFGLARVLGSFNAALCGYGFQPFRLLLWMVVQLLVCSTVVTLLSPDSPILALHSSLVNYLNPLGIGDVKGLPGPATSALVVESYAGSVSMSVFFALLVGRWFQP